MNQGIVNLVDDNQAFRHSTRWLLESEGLQVQEYASAEAFLQTYRAGAALDDSGEVLLLDIRMPGMSGLQLQDELIKRGIDLPIVFITAHGDVPMAVEAMRKGAVNFIEKPFTDETILQVISNALSRSRNARKRDSEEIEARSRFESLTARERQVLDLVIEGKLNKIIAATLGISIKTVELHRAHVMEKMKAKSLAHLVQLTLSARRAMSPVE